MKCKNCETPLELLGRNRFNENIYKCESCESYFLEVNDSLLELEDLTIQDIADIEGLEVVETTKGNNGYPENVKKALMGFESFEQFEEVQSRWNLNSIELSKQDGHQLWLRGDYQFYEPIKYTSDDFGEIADMFTSKDEANEQLMCEIIDKFGDLFDAFDVWFSERTDHIEELRGFLEQAREEHEEDYEEDLDELERYVKNAEKILFKIDDLDVGEGVVCKLVDGCLTYDYTTQVEVTEYQNGIYHYSMGLEFM